jgi:FtsH-binding integral membrane protein
MEELKDMPMEKPAFAQGAVLPNRFEIDESAMRSVATTHKDEKEGFLRKVFGIVSFQLVITFIIAFGASASENFGSFCSHPATIIFSLLLLIVGMVCALIFKDKVPWNYCGLISFTVGESFIIASSTAAIDPEIVLTAIVITLLMSTGLTGFACVATEDNIVHYLIFTLCLWIMEFLVLGLVITRFAWLESLLYSLCALGYGSYLVVDAFVIKEQYSVDEYIPAAIIIYLDIIRIFMYVLAALAKKK